MKKQETTKRDADTIQVRGARQNNLKNLDLDIEPYTWTVITGPSGSGKSSLAFDTLYSEGQRRYVETFSAYVRQFLDRRDQPDVDSIKGIPPAIAINQSNAVRTSRSTVGTMTEINDHLKLLFSREAHLFCRSCGEAVNVKSAFDMWEDIKERAQRAGDPRLVITFDVLFSKKLTREFVMNALSSQGFTRIHTERNTRQGTILSVTVDRFRASKADQSRALEAIETALKSGRGEYANKFAVHALTEDGKEALWPYAAGLTCAACDIAYSKPSSALFSFNSPLGACPVCHGFGRIIDIDMDLVIDSNKSLKDGCIRPWAKGGAYEEWQKSLLHFAQGHNIPDFCSFAYLSDWIKRWVIEGDSAWDGNFTTHWAGVRRFFDYLESKSYNLPIRVLLSRYRTYQPCPECGGSRMKPAALLWRIGSREAANAALGVRRRFLPPEAPGIKKNIQNIPGLTLYDLMLLPISELQKFFDVLSKEKLDEAGALVVSQIRTRLSYLMNVGLGYLTLDRQSRTLSGGEIQRVNLTTALGTNLVDTLFVLDEPSVGLHPRDMDRVNALLENLRDAGNTLVVVEHDPQVMLAADRIIDMGPGAGVNGGQIVFDGTPKELRQSPTLTGQYLSGVRSITTNLQQTPPTESTKWLELTGAAEHNLKSIDVRFPLGCITTVTGVSGSGKSTLVVDTLFPLLERYFGRAAPKPAYESIRGQEGLLDVHIIDQSAISKTTRSTPAIYVGAFDGIRKIFANTQKARDRDYTAGHFSFNSELGQCPTCQGSGFEHVEMQFLSDVYLRCPDCGGKRYRPEILEVTINRDGKKELSIADILDMTVSEALRYFDKNLDIVQALMPLESVGLGYIKLGQPLPTLSGGEAQRIKLAGELAKSKSMTAAAGHLYILDEPTTGLHFDDIAKLISALRRLTQAGATVILIEHNLDVIDASDWVIDLGPEGGDEGGEIVATGTPDAIAKEKTWTGLALAAYRKTRIDPSLTMTGLFAKPTPKPKELGRSMQSVWRNARAGDLGIFGARENNLKNINVVVPRRKLSVVTGISGSGKSTLAFSVIFAEGQRRYLETFNAYARSMVQPAAAPDIDALLGIAPTVAIEQRISQGGYKSTVATQTEIQQYLRLLYAKLGVQYCPDCNLPVEPQTQESIFSSILKSLSGKSVTFTAPIVRDRKGSYVEIFSQARNSGITKLRVDGKWLSTGNTPRLSRYSQHTIEMPIATLQVASEHEEELRLAISRTLNRGDGFMEVYFSIETPSGKETEGHRSFSIKRACPKCGRSFPEPDPQLFSYNSSLGWCPKCNGLGKIYVWQQDDFDIRKVEKISTEPLVCPNCQGERLNPIARAFRFKNWRIGEITALTVEKAIEVFSSMQLTGREKAIGEAPIKEILSKLRFLNEVGLGYLTLERAAPTLSGGEAQRIRLASQLGNNLQGVCYVLDEPTIGLHARDNERLISSLISLKEKGNTVIVVEHDEDMIRHADHIVDIGPGAGSRGGSLVVEGTVNEVTDCKESVTGQFLKHPLAHTGIARHPVCKGDPAIKLSKATLHNLKELTVRFPTGRLIAITGVSGSGKSTLARSILLPNLQAAVLAKRSRGIKKYEPTNCKSISGYDSIQRVLEVDQTPIGKTPRSCPATYVGLYTPIRQLFAETTVAKEHGWGTSRFSFNIDEGNCPVCGGQGQITIEMNFLPDMKQTCEACKGSRFNEETLTALWHGYSIGDVLQMSVDEALPVFETNSAIAKKLRLLQDVGLGYLKLGQPSTTLSGGEAQRIKLVSELSKAVTSIRTNRRIETFYIFDEPTVGLHMADVQKLISVLHTLVDAGHTVLVVEHNLDLIAEADYVIDLGPEGGNAGGTIVGKGEPAQIAKRRTPTGRALKQFLKTHKEEHEASETNNA